MARGSTNRTFGLTSSGRGGRWRGGSNNTGFRGRGRGSFRGRGRGTTNGSSSAPTADEGSLLEAKFEEAKIRDEVDATLGFERVSEGLRREGWLVNMHPVSCSP